MRVKTNKQAVEAKTVEITFAPERETPGTWRFKEVFHNGHPVGEGEEIVGCLYVKKPYVIMAGGKPAPVKITLAVAE